ncbi:MAG: PH domain-containing protein [Bacteroidia bacterium]|nr:PH domain-containing protein [Bacteroidia bacterium]
MRTTLKENEKIAAIVRKHWFVLVRPAILVLFSIIVTVIFPDPSVVGILGIFTAIMILWLIYRIIDRNSNIWVVTNLRVVDEHGVFSSNSKETPLNKINNVSFRQPLFGRIFNYGHMEIQSAAESGTTIHRWIQNPQLLKNTITESQERYRQDQLKDQADNLASAFTKSGPASMTMADELQKLYLLKEKGVITEEEYQKGKDKLLS